MSDNSENTAKAPPPNPLARQTTYRFVAGDIDRAVEGRLNAESKHIKINGFRPGRAPLNVLKQRFGEKILHDTLLEKASASFQEEEKNADWRLAASPVVVPSMIAATGEGYTVECHYEILPDVMPPSFEKQELKRPLLPINDPEVGQMVEKLRRDSGTYQEVSRPAASMDTVIVDFKVFIGEELLEEGKERRWVVNSSMLRAEINEKLLGIAPDDKTEIEITYPEEHNEERLRGQTARMEVHAKKILEIVLPDLNEEFFARFGVKEGGLSAFHDTVRQHLSREVDNRLRTTLHERALNLLIVATPRFDLPQSMLRAELKSLLQQAQQQHERMGMTAAQIKIEELFPEAARRVSLGLILAAWQQREAAVIDDTEINNRLDELAESYESPKDFIASMRGDKNQMQALRLSLLEEKVVSWVCEKAAAGEETVTLAQLLGGAFSDIAPPAAEK